MLLFPSLLLLLSFLSCTAQYTNNDKGSQAQYARGVGPKVEYFAPDLKWWPHGQEAGARCCCGMINGLADYINPAQCEAANGRCCNSCFNKCNKDGFHVLLEEQVSRVGGLAKRSAARGGGAARGAERAGVRAGVRAGEQGGRLRKDRAGGSQQSGGGEGEKREPGHISNSAARKPGQGEEALRVASDGER